MSRINDQIRTKVDYWALAVYQDDPITFSITADERTLTQSRYCRYNFTLSARSSLNGNIYLARQMKVKWDSLDMLITFEFACRINRLKPLAYNHKQQSLSHCFCHLVMLMRVKLNLSERKKKKKTGWVSVRLQFEAEELRVLHVSLMKGITSSAAWQQQSRAGMQD